MYRTSLVGGAAFEFVLASALLASLLYGHAIGLLGAYCIGAVLCTCALKVVAGTTSTEAVLRRWLGLSFVLDGTLVIAGFQLFVAFDVYGDTLPAYLLAGLSALVYVGMGVETWRGTLLDL